MMERDCQAILRPESINDQAMFREHVITHPERLRAALGYGPGLELVPKRICVSGTIAPGQWDAEFTATTFEEFVSGLYSRKEFPEPVNHWAGATGKADAA